MAKYRITGPDGSKYDITAPDDAKPEDVMSFFQGRTGAKEKTGALSAAAQGVGQGLSFGFSDEIEGGVRGAVDALTSDKSFGDAYQERTGAARDRLSQAASDQPVAYYGGEIGSAFAVPGALARLGVRGAMAGASGRGLGARTAAGAREGAAYGAAYGAGKSEGGAENTAKGTLGGAVAGGVIGSALPGLIDAGSALVNPLRTAVRGFTNPQAVAREKVGEALARDVGSSGRPRDIRAAQDRINTRAANSADDPTMMMADVGGENTRRLMRQANDMPNDRVQQFNKRLDQRQSFQPARIERALESTLGDGKEFYATAEQLVQTRASNAAPAFKRGYAAPWDVKADDPLAKFLTGRKYMERLIQKTTENIEGVTGENVAHMRPWELLHRVKMQINKEIGRVKRGDGDSVANWDVRDLTRLNQEFKTHIRNANPEMGRALDDFSDESSLVEALKDGFEDFNTMQPEALSATMKGLSKDEADLYRLGSARALIEKVRKGNVTRDRTEGIFSSPEISKKLTAVFSDHGQRRQLQRMLVREARKADTRKAVQGGSKTSQNLATADEAGAPMRAVQAATNALSGRLEPALAFVGRQANRFSGLTPEVASNILAEGMRPASQGMNPLVNLYLRQAAEVPGERAAMANRLMGGSVAATNAGEPRQRGLRGGSGPRFERIP